MSEGAGLISCIMPTADRRAFVPLAIRAFLGQDYAPRELIVLDDGTDPVADLMPADERIRYIRLERRLSVGAKRNRGCEMARGDLIAHWDDDDWSAPGRLSQHAQTMAEAGGDACGLARVWFYDPVRRLAWEYRYPDDGSPWVAGGTLCYRKALWRQRPFADVEVGEDTRFIWSLAGARIVPMADNRFYVATIHSGNTSVRQTDDSRYVTASPGVVEALLGDDLVSLATACGAVGVARAPAARRTSMRLNLGCCDNLLAGYVNVDIVGGSGIEVADLRQQWPWPDDSVEHVRAWDVIEHLPDKIFTMNELWRVLAPGGTVEIAVPTTDGPGAFQDPTHVSFWNRRSFLYYEAGNPYRERFARSYGISARFRTLSEHTDLSDDGQRLTIVLQAVKP